MEEAWSSKTSGVSATCPPCMRADAGEGEKGGWRGIRNWFPSFEPRAHGRPSALVAATARSLRPATMSARELGALSHAFPNMQAWDVANQKMSCVFSAYLRGGFARTLVEPCDPSGAYYICIFRGTHVHPRWPPYHAPNPTLLPLTPFPLPTSSHPPSLAVLAF